MVAKAEPNASKIQEVADTIADCHDADVVLYSGGILWSTPRKFSVPIQRRKRRTNVLLVLVTFGGDPDAAYCIARCLQDHYTKFILFVPGFCKSAGTLIALGAHALIMSDDGQLGPTDVQMSKKDEIFEQQSGLVVGGALQSLQERAYNAFSHFLYEYKTGIGRNATMRTASEVAVNLTNGLFGPIYGQIDPMHVGESGRAITIAKQYATRLQSKCQNYTTETLEYLIAEYPSHTFVIDRDEATKLFKNIRAASDDEMSLAAMLGDKAHYPQPYRQEIDNNPEFLSTEKIVIPADLLGGNNGDDAIQLGARPAEAVAGAGENVQNDGDRLNSAAARRN